VEEISVDREGASVGIEPGHCANSFCNTFPFREIEGPMATVILGGLVTSTVLNLLVLPTPALRYGKFEPRM
jgi:hypothetical protein